MKQHTLIKKILSFLFPEKCASCEKSGSSLCRECINRFSRSKETELTYAKALFQYKDKQVERTIKNLKNYQKPELAKVISGLMYSNFLPEISDLALFGGEKIILVPIPASNLHMKKRFRNHSLLLAEKFFENDKNYFEICDCLIKTRHSSPQSEIKTRESRIKNAENLYKVREKFIPQVRGKTILIIDDITTTGATIENAKKALEKSGALEVRAICFAH